jgi:hypothetical protein
MENVVPSMTIGSRRNEDIALDLLKFVAGHTDIGKMAGVGFQTGSAKEKQDQVEKLLDLYARCLTAVQRGRG